MYHFAAAAVLDLLDPDELESALATVTGPVIIETPGVAVQDVAAAALVGRRETSSPPIHETHTFTRRTP